MPRRKSDPLIAALIAKLPAGGEWPTEQQIAWLNLMAMAFGAVYGGDAAAQLGNKSAAKFGAVTTPPKPKLRHQFVIDEQGYVKRGTGERVNPGDVTGEIHDLRYGEADLRSIVWADGSAGLNGLDLIIVGGA